MNTINKNQKLSIRAKLGFGVASIADAIAYDFVAVFFLFFLTEAAGIRPSFAGIIIFASVLWDAVTDPMVGMWSDSTKCKYGKKRPFLLCSAVPLGIIMVLLFTLVDLDGVFKNIYYLLMAMAFWTAYTTFNIPYYALGGCITLDNNERTSLSAYRQVFNYIGLFCASALPAILIGVLKESGYSIKDAYLYVAIILGVIISIAILITWRATRGKEIITEESNNSMSLKGIVEIFKLKPYKFVNIAQLLFYIGYTFPIAVLLYYSTYILGMGEIGAGIIFAVSTISGVIYVPIISKLAMKFDKRRAYIFCLVIAGIICIVAKFIPMVTITSMIIYILLYNIGGVAFWTLIFPMYYDIAEIDEFKNGKRREGLITSFASFIIKLGAASAAALSGVILDMNGYVGNATEQVPSAIATIKSLVTLYPGILLLTSGLVIILYPITKERYQALIKNLELKKAGKEYTTEGFKELL